VSLAPQITVAYDLAKYYPLSYSEPMVNSLENLQRLTVPERLELIEYLWDSIVMSGEQLEVSQGQKGELDARLLEYTTDKKGSSWSDVKARLKSSK
jgi:putative addiction module component (TIGR02574 family)